MSIRFNEMIEMCVRPVEIFLGSRHAMLRPGGVEIMFLSFSNGWQKS